jgi:hypothetical protein
MSLKVIKKKSAKRGENTSAPEVEILNVSGKGLWLLARGREYFLPTERFPWFENATVADICRVKLLHGYHLYWPALDVDLELSSLGNLENYPLIYR